LSQKSSHSAWKPRRVEPWGTLMITARARQHCVAFGSKPEIRIGRWPAGGMTTIRLPRRIFKWDGTAEFNQVRSFMSTYRTSRSLIVDAVQSVETKTIATDLGFINVRQGEWVICGEGGECYIVDNAFFHRTFEAVKDARIPESGRSACEIPASGVVCGTTDISIRTGPCRNGSRRGMYRSRKCGSRHARYR
jgi:hypothetical protein